MPVPSAVLIAWTSVFFSTRSIRAFSTLMIFPRHGTMACNLELRFAHLHRDDGRQAVPNVVTGEVGVLVLEQFLVFRVLVDHRCQRATETLFMGAALMGVDRVGEGMDRLRVPAVPLHRDFDFV